MILNGRNKLPEVFCLNEVYWKNLMNSLAAMSNRDLANRYFKKLTPNQEKLDEQFNTIVNKTMDKTVNRQKYNIILYTGIVNMQYIYDKISGLEVANTAPDEEIIAKARTYLREHMSDELKTAKKSLKDAWAKLKEPKLSEEQKKTIADKADECWKAVKDKVKDIKAPKTLLFAAGAAAIGLVLGLVLRPKAKEQPAPQQGFVA